MESTSSSTEIKHYLMISALIERLKKGGYTEIEADHITNAVRPGEILGEDGALTPDVVASKNGRKIFFEVKTAEELFSPRTEEQIRTFLRYAEETGGEFCLLVPARCCVRVKYLLDSLQLPETTVLYI